MSSGIFNIGLNNSNGTLVLSKSGTMTLQFSQTGPAGYQVPAARTVNAGTGLTGGGSLTSDITLSADFGTTAGKVCQGNDARLSDARTPTSHTHPASQISDSTSAGRTILTAADAAAQRTALGLGTVATQNADAVALTGGTLQGIGVVTGSYTSNVNEALLRSCRKQSAGTITKGQVVYITGSTGSHLEVELADADTEVTSSKTFGVAAETITSSAEGYVIVEGLLTGLSNLPTASFANGDSLWLSSTAGGWQTTPPVDPAHGVYIGRVINASNGSNGSAFIKIQNGYEINELHDVLITAPQDSTQALYYDSVSGLWKNRAAVDADLAAITVFPRFDADQSATDTQKRTARRNIGFSDSFTTADLLALSSTEAAKLRIAYCSDCLTTKGYLSDVGDFVFWNGLNWIIASTQTEPTTSLPLFAFRLYRRCIGATLSIPSNSIWAGLSQVNITSGTGATNQSDATFNDGRLAGTVTGTGTTATGTGRRVAMGFSANNTVSTSRHLMSVVGYNFIDVSAAPDTWHYRDSIETYQNTATAAVQSDMCSLVYDASNILGFGSTGANRFALIRANGTTTDWIDTGVAVATAHHTILTQEIVGVNQVRMQVATALSNGTGFQVVADRTVTLSGANMHTVFAFAKATGTTSKTTSRVNNAQWTAIKANTTAPTAVLS